MIWRLLIVLALLSAADGMDTVYELNHGVAAEMNPLLAPLLARGLWAVLIVKVGLVGVLAICAALVPIRPRVVGALVVIYTCLMGWHVLVLEGIV